MQYTEEQQLLIKKCKLALDKAKLALMLKPDTTFFTSVCFSLKQKINFEHSTAATDGLTIYYNPNFALSLTPAELIFLVLHETLHVALMHMIRGVGKDHEVMNMAADHVINLMLIERGFTMPACGLADPRFTGMHTEQVYKILMAEKAAQMPLPFNAMAGDILPTPKDAKEEEVQAQIENIIVQASIRSAQEGDKPGSIPGVLQILIDRLVDPKLPWQRILQKHLTVYAKDDYSWRKPNRRYFPEMHLPSLYSERLASLAIAVDTSGSVSNAEFQHMVSEIASIFKMMKPASITLIQFDTRVHTVTEVKSISGLLACKFTGRGGTMVQEVMEWAEKNQPQLLIVFTDGGFRHPHQTYSKPAQKNTLWLIHNNPNFTAPFGKKMHYEIGAS